MVSDNQPTDGERVCTLQSPIGPFWSHALFLIPLRTCFIALSPHTGSDQTEITGQQLVLDWLVLLLLSAGKRKQRALSVFLVIVTDILNVSTGVWMLKRCCQDFGQRQGDRVLFQRDSSPPTHTLRARLRWMQQPKRSE